MPRRLLRGGLVLLDGVICNVAGGILLPQHVTLIFLGSRKQPGHDYPDIRSDDQADQKTPIEHLDYLLRLVGTA